MRWQLFPRRGFVFVADGTRRITWSVSTGRLAVIVAGGVAYGPMGIGGGSGARRRRGAGPMRAARPATPNEAARPARGATPTDPRRAPLRD